MSITLDEAYAIIEKNIVGNLTHPHYKRVIELAKLYKQLITGKDIDDLLQRFAKREDEDLFAQRKLLTQLITPSVAASVRAPFYKVGRINNITKKIQFEKTENDTDRKTKLEKALLKYYGEKSLESYLQTRFVDLSFTDPNAFIVTEFDPVELGPNDEMTAVPQPRPFEVSSTQAVNFRYENNLLQWLLVQLPITYEAGKDIKPGFSYTLYFPTNSIRYTQVDIKKVEHVQEGGIALFVNSKNEQVEVWRADKDRAFIIEEFTHNSQIIPAIRVGYKTDLYTSGATCVNPFHDALPYFMKSIKTVSEFDLTMALHAFPQKFQYVNKCTGLNPEVGCNNGQTVEGSTCKKCSGTGVAIHTSAQDAVVMRMPNDVADMKPLDQMVHYEHPPIELLKFQNEYIDSLEVKCHKAVFNSQIFAQAQIANTATAEVIKLDSVNDVLAPFAEKYSDVYVQAATISAYYVDITDAVIIHQFPKDFKFKDATTLLGELKLATESGAPGYVRRELSNDLAEQQFIDKPDELKRIRIKEKFFPFPDKSSTEILFIISNDKTSEFNEVLWANFDNIFAELESKEEDNGKYLYDYPIKAIREKLKTKVDALIISMKSSAPAVAVGFGKEDELE